MRKLFVLLAVTFALTSGSVYSFDGPVVETQSKVKPGIGF